MSGKDIAQDFSVSVQTVRCVFNQVALTLSQRPSMGLTSKSLF